MTENLPSPAEGPAPPQPNAADSLLDPADVPREWVFDAEGAKIHRQRREVYEAAYDAACDCSQEVLLAESKGGGIDLGAAGEGLEKLLTDHPSIHAAVEALMPDATADDRLRRTARLNRLRQMLLPDFPGPDLFVDLYELFEDPDFDDPEFIAAHRRMLGAIRATADRHPIASLEILDAWLPYERNSATSYEIVLGFLEEAAEHAPILPDWYPELVEHAEWAAVRRSPDQQSLCFPVLMRARADIAAGRCAEGDAVFEKLLAANPDRNRIVMAWSRAYRRLPPARRNIPRGAEILARGLPGGLGWYLILEELAKIKLFAGQRAEAAALEREAKRAKAAERRDYDRVREEKSRRPRRQSDRPAGFAEPIDEDDPFEPLGPAGPADVTGTRVGRNDPCPCGSGKKFKKCCG